MARGHIRQKKNKDGTLKKDVFEIIYDAPIQPGQKRNQKSVTFHGSITKAQKELRKILTQIDNNTYVGNDKLTVKQFLERWLRDYCEVNLAETTKDSYRSQ